MTRTPDSKPPPADTTRAALLDAATTVFADQGYANGSVRLITRAAAANQAAITYHFGGKDGLYRAVLRAAVADFEAHNLIDAQSVATLDRVEALRLVMRQFLVPLTQSGRLGRYVRIFGREAVDPSPVYKAFFAAEPPMIIAIVGQLVQRFLPEDTDPQRIALTTFWLVQQPIAIVHNAGRLASDPYRIVFDDDAIERLIDFLTELSLGGLAAAESR